jgi:hypothetical protein
MNKLAITHIQSTPVFYVETQIAIKPQNVFSYMSLRITFIGRTNFLFFQLQLEEGSNPLLGYNLREAPTPQFSGYNQKEDTTPYVLQIQPKGGYNHLSLPRLTSLTYK